MRSLRGSLAALLLAWPLAARAAEPEKLVLGVTAVVEFTPAYVAVSRGIFAAHGLDVTLQIAPNSSTLVPGILSGGVQIGGPPAAVFLPAISQGLPLVCLAAASVTDPAKPVGAVLGPMNSTIATAKDLEGKRLAVSGINSVMQILLRDWMTGHGADPAKSIFVEVPFSRMADVLKAGSVDGVVVVEPFVTRIREAGIGKIVADYYRDVPEGTLSAAYCSTRVWAAAHPEAVAEFRASLEEAGRFVIENPDAAHAILAQTLKLPPEVAASLPFTIRSFRLTTAQVAWWVRVLRAQGVIDADIDPASMIVP